MNTKHLITRPALALTAWLAASLLPNFSAASSATSYPLLPDLPGADIYGEARIVIYLDQDVPLVEVDGQLFALGGRPLELAFDDLESITLLLVVPLKTGVFVTENGIWTHELDPSITLVAFDLMVGESDELALELALPGQPAPTVPDVVIRPTADDPDPT
jgi:hypothetical protein